MNEELIAHGLKYSGCIKYSDLNIVAVLLWYKNL